jgi:hypothetical protein
MKNTITVVIPTKKINEKEINKIKKSFSHPKNQYLIYENQGESLTEIYNKALSEAENDIVVFMHDDITIETLNVTPKIVKLFNDNPEYGIIGVAGTTHLKSGMWWEDKESMVGQVYHQQGEKKWLSKYSGLLGDNLKEVVCIDGLFMAINKNKIKHTFDEDFKLYHFYDIPVCIKNYLDGVKIGVTTKIKLIHKSVGEVDNTWLKSKYLFESKFLDKLPLKI